MPVADLEQGEESDIAPKANQPRKSSRRRRKNRRVREEYIGYAMRPSSWDYYFSFRVSDPKSR
jgi:hypothetical protein